MQICLWITMYSSSTQHSKTSMWPISRSLYMNTDVYLDQKRGVHFDRQVRVNPVGRTVNPNANPILHVI